MKALTIFTPTYNRGYILHKLYNSLCIQKNQNFVWLIVDDGSTDGTRALIENWIAESKIDIKYFHQENGGKMRAYNKGLKECTTPLFVCVDSDDYLTENAISDILNFWHENYSGEQNVAGMVANRLMVSSSNSKPIETVQLPMGIRSCSMRDLGQLYGHIGETSIVFLSTVAKRFPFPEIEGERFITESFIYDQIDYSGFKFLIYQNPFVFCEYFPDGYTRSRAAIYRDAPLGWAMYFNQQIKFWKSEISHKAHLKSLTYYIIMSKLGGRTFADIYNQSSDKSMYFAIAALLAPYYKYKLMKLF